MFQDPIPSRWQELQRSITQPDHDIRCYPQLGRNRLSRRYAEPLPDIALIECKSALDDDVSPRELLAPLRTRATRFSKYAVGSQRLGYVGAV